MCIDPWSFKTSISMKRRKERKKKKKTLRSMKKKGEKEMKRFSKKTLTLKPLPPSHSSWPLQNGMNDNVDDHDGRTVSTLSSLYEYLPPVDGSFPLNNTLELSQYPPVLVLLPFFVERPSVCPLSHSGTLPVTVPRVVKVLKRSPNRTDRLSVVEDKSRVTVDILPNTRRVKKPPTPLIVTLRIQLPFGR